MFKYCTAVLDAVFVRITFSNVSFWKLNLCLLKTHCRLIKVSAIKKVENMPLVLQSAKQSRRDCHEFCKHLLLK